MRFLRKAKVFFFIFICELECSGWGSTLIFYLEEPNTDIFFSAKNLRFSAYFLREKILKRSHIKTLLNF